MARVIVSKEGQRVVVAADPRTVVAKQPAQVSAVAVAAGPQGPRGPAGSGSAYDVAGVSGSALQGSRVVCLDADDRLIHPDLLSLQDGLRVIGVVTTAAAAAGQPVNVRRRGPVEEAAWSFDEGPIYVGAGGVLTQSPPAEPAWLLQIGTAIDASTVEVNPQPLIA